MTAARRLLQQQHKHRSRPGSAPAALNPQQQGVCSSSSSSSSQRRSRPGKLNKQQQIEGGGEHEETGWQQQLQQQLAGVRLQELQEAAAQQQVELRASQGLDGPRPCLCSNGLERLGGREHASAAAVQRSLSACGGSAAGGELRRSAVVERKGGRGAVHRHNPWKGVHEV
jgi:hypothetical protein